MEQVTDRSPTLTALEHQMSQLILDRNAVIDAAENMIDRANSEFDSVALPLGREINRVRKAVERQAPRNHPTSTRKAKVLAGLDDDEQAYFESLKQKVKK